MHQIVILFVCLILLASCQSAQPKATLVPTAAPPATPSGPYPTPLQVEGFPILILPKPATPKPAAISASILLITGRVVDLDGAAVVGAAVTTADGETTTNDQGWFSLPAGQDRRWVTVTHPNFLSRTRAAAIGSPALVRLTPDDGETVSLHFGGDTMFGRRFYDPNEDGETSDGLIQIGSEAKTQADHLRHVQPLLANADLTVINFESPLTTEPVANPIIEPIRDPAVGLSQPRPPQYHQTKSYVYTSHASAPAVLRSAGVDILGLGNNHMYDTLETGLGATLEAIQQAGFQPGAGYFGAGLSEAEAWRPAVVTLGGQTFAFLGCTTIHGREHPISYVVSDAEGKGGAAECTKEAIRTAVTAAAAAADTVVFMVHGGYEYARTPSSNVQQLTFAAREAGAALLINHHPHVVGGFDWDGDSLIAWTLGNFLFDQTLWPTFQSYLLTVHVRRGKAVRAYLEPLMIEGYAPKGLTGQLANYVARGAAGYTTAPFVIEDGALEIDIQNKAVISETTELLDGGLGNGTIFDLTAGRNIPLGWLSNFSGTGAIRLGRDLLWVGSFEDEDVDADVQEGALWDFSDANRYVGSDYAYRGTAGAQLQRGSQSEHPNILTPLHRIPIQPGTELSVIGMARKSANAEVSLQLSWYPDTLGPSSTRTITPDLLHSNDEWEPFRADAVVPMDTVAVGLYLRLSPPQSGVATVDFDDLKLIAWAPAGAPFSPLYNHLWLVGNGEATFRSERFPGAQ